MNDQPSSAPETIGQDARDDADAPSVLRDTGTDTPGGGGLGGADAGTGAAGATGGASPNAPVTGAVPPAKGDTGAAREAKVLATDPKDG